MVSNTTTNHSSIGAVLPATLSAKFYEFLNVLNILEGNAITLKSG